MKLLHLGDLHLGKSLGDFDLIKDQRFILEQVLEIVEKQAVDAVLLAGDIYDKAIPSEAATRLLDEFLLKLSKSGAKTYIISGNHDSDDRLNYGSRLFEANNIFISALFDGTLAKQTLQDEYGEVNIYLLPFVKASQVRFFYPEAKIESYDDAVRTIIENAGIDTTKRNVLVAHQFVAGKSEDTVCGGSESISTLNVGLVERIGSDCFDEFDYVALGHIHSPQRVGREAVRYSGSLLKYSVDEANNDKSLPLITLGEKDEVVIDLIPLKPMRDLRHIKGKLKDLLDPANVTGEEDFIYVTLTDEDIINDAMGIIQMTYKNCVKLDYDNSRTREVGQVDISKVAESKSFEEIICDFYKLIYGCDINDEEMSLMKEAAKEAGGKYEAD